MHVALVEVAPAVSNHAELLTTQHTEYFIHWPNLTSQGTFAGRLVGTPVRGILGTNVKCSGSSLNWRVCHS
jgi:hypothetical protein